MDTPAVCRSISSFLQIISGWWWPILLPPLPPYHSGKESQLQELKSAVEFLTKEVTLLKSVIPQPQQIIGPQPSSNQSPQATQSTPALSHSSGSTNQKQVAIAVKKVDDKSQDDHKFNVVIYGIDECSKGTLKKEWLNHDPDIVTSVIAEGETALALYLFVIS